jgi:hypothetical protein
MSLALEIVLMDANIGGTARELTNRRGVTVGCYAHGTNARGPQWTLHWDVGELQAKVAFQPRWWKLCLTTPPSSPIALVDPSPSPALSSVPGRYCRHRYPPSHVIITAYHQRRPDLLL